MESWTTWYIVTSLEWVPNRILSALWRSCLHYGDRATCSVRYSVKALGPVESLSWISAYQKNIKKQKKSFCSVVLVHFTGHWALRIATVNHAYAIRLIPSRSINVIVVILSFLRDLSPPLRDRHHLRRVHDVLHDGGLHLRPRNRNRAEASRVNAARPAPDSDLRFVLRVAPLRDRVFTADGVVREGSRVPELLRQGVHAPPCFHGTLEVLLWAEGGGPRLGLAQADSWRRRFGPLLGFLPCLLLERKVRLSPYPSSLFTTSLFLCIKYQPSYGHKLVDYWDI